MLFCNNKRPYQVLPHPVLSPVCRLRPSHHHTFRCDDTRGCVMQFWPLDDEHMCSKHVGAWNKLTVKQEFLASSWLITEIIITCVVNTSQHHRQRNWIYEYSIARYFLYFHCLKIDKNRLFYVSITVNTRLSGLQYTKPFSRQYLYLNCLPLTEICHSE